MKHRRLTSENIPSSICITLLTVCNVMQRSTNGFFVSTHNPERHQYAKYPENNRDIKSDLGYTKVSGVITQYILRSGRLWHPPLSRSMLDNK